MTWKVYEHEEFAVEVEVVRNTDLKHIESSGVIYPAFYTVEDREKPEAYIDDVDAKRGSTFPTRFIVMGDAKKVCARLLMLAKGEDRDVGR